MLAYNINYIMYMIILYLYDNTIYNILYINHISAFIQSYYNMTYHASNIIYNILIIMIIIILLFAKYTVL